MPDGAYTLAQVERLLGLHEGTGRHGARHVTAADLISWAKDPGGDNSWYGRLQTSDPAHAWTARRGPLPPDGNAACVLYDFLRAVKRRGLLEQAIIALTVFGFSAEEIAAVLALDPKALSERAVESRRKRVARMIEGRPRRDHDGHVLRDEAGDVISTGGIAVRLLRHMNGGGR